MKVKEKVKVGTRELDISTPLFKNRGVSDLVAEFRERKQAKKDLESTQMEFVERLIDELNTNISDELLAQDVSNGDLYKDYVEGWIDYLERMTGRFRTYFEYEVIIIPPNDDMIPKGIYVIWVGPDSRKLEEYSKIEIVNYLKDKYKSYL